MKACFQIAECSFSSAKLSNIPVTSKYLASYFILFIQVSQVRELIEVKEVITPSNFPTCESSVLLSLKVSSEF